MTDPARSLNTRWSMLDRLQGHEAEDSWRWFVDRYRPYITACLLRRIRPRERAEQAADEFWSYLYTSEIVADADRSRRFRSYLAGALRNYALSWLRRNPPTSGEPPADLAVDDRDPARELETQDDQAWTRHVVQLALDQLANRHAEQAQVLRWFYGLPSSTDAPADEPRSASWIAARLGLKANAVHQIVFRGRKRLRSCIENELRETVQNVDDLDDELRLVLEGIAAASPGLEG